MADVETQCSLISNHKFEYNQSIFILTDLHHLNNCGCFPESFHFIQTDNIVPKLILYDLKTV